MVKRYYGGLMTATKVVASATQASGIYNKNIHIQAVRANSWPTATFIDTYVTDPLFSYNSLLINADTTVTPFNADTSTNNFNITVVGDTKAANFSPYTPGYYSNYFDGSGDYLEFPSNSANFLHICSAPWTFEYWFYTSSTSTQNIFSTDADSVSVGINIALSNGASQNIDVQIYRGSSGNFYRFYTGTAWSLNAWNHVAIAYNGSTFAIYVNGVSQSLTTSGTATFSASNATYQPAIGVYKSGSGLGNYFTGYISNLRAVNGSAVYTGNFIPPTTPLTVIANTSLLTCNSNRLIDNSTNNFTITKNGDTTVVAANPFAPVSSYATYGSAYFDGTGDYLSIPSSSNLVFGTGDFCVEMWYYQIGNAGAGLFSNSVSSGGGDAQFEIQLDPTNLYPRLVGWASVFLTSSVAGKLNSWNHLAVCRSGTTASIFLNGTQVATGTVTNNFSNTNAFNIGRQAANSGYLNGYIADLRAVKGSAVYTGNFTPPTLSISSSGATSAASYSNTANVNTTFSSANTSLLTLQNNQPHNNHTFLDKSNFKSLVNRFGNATQGTFTPYGANWSNYFDGTGDYLTVPAGTAAMGTGDFSVELWVYHTTSGALAGYYYQGEGGSGGGINFRKTAADKLQLSHDSVQDVVTSTASIPINQWVHVAVTRSSGTVRLFINGVLDGSVTYTGNFTGTTGLQNIGTILSNNYFLTGYISNLRVVKGNAVYTAAFTPPRSPLTTVAGTEILTCQSNRFKDNSTNNFTITKNGDTKVQIFSPFAPGSTYNYYTPEVYGGSSYFDGSGDYISLPNSVSHASLPGDFTVECWFYLNTVSGIQTIISHRTANTGTGGYVPFLIWMESAVLTLYVSSNNSSWDVVSQGILATLTAGQWYHLAYTRTGSTFRVFINGVQTYTFTSSAVYSTSNALQVGMTGPSETGAPLNGYISDVRITKGTGVYTGNFTPPTKPLGYAGTASIYPSSTNVNTTFSAANTTVKLDFADAGFKDYTMIVNMETLGDVKITTANSKFGGSAMYFDGTGDYLSFASNPLYAIGTTEDYTVECWVNFNTVQTCAFWQTTNNISSASGPFWFGYESGALKSSQHGSGTYAVSYTWSPSTGTWYHVAATRSSGTVRLFVNGTVVTTNASTQSGIGFTQSGAAVGVLTTPAYFVGYLDDLRFTKGNARYTANFTPAINSFALR